MLKHTRYILAAVLAAYLIGAAPAIIDFISSKIIVNSANTLSFRPQAIAYISEISAWIRSCSKYIIAAYAVFIAALIFLENSNPDRTIIWIAVLIFLPLVGLIFYLVLGPDFDNLKRRRQFRPKNTLPVPQGYEGDLRVQTAQLLRTISGAQLTQRNRICPLINGEETFDAMFDAMNRAEKFIHLQSFIIKDDKTGRKLQAILIDAAKRGVHVRVLYDAIGSRHITAAYVQELKDAGVQCVSFMPVSFPLFRRRMNHRNHRKICVVDGIAAFTGGLNFSNNYIHEGNMGFWRDTHIMAEGESVKELHKIFLADWEYRTKEPQEKVLAEDGVTYRTDFDDMPEMPLQVVTSGISEPWHSIEMGFMSMISRAKERIWITTPYIVPGPRVMSALRMAAMSGVDVRIIVPEKGDHFLVYWCSRSSLEELLSAGVKIFCYSPGFIHAKVMVADNDICSVGTCNLDIRSLEINFEDQLFIYDNKMTEIFAQQFEKDFADSRELLLESWRKRPFIAHVLESFGKLYSAQL